MTSDEVAEIALRALAAKRPLVVTGWRNKVLAFVGAHTPKPLAARVSRKILARLRGRPE